MISFFYDVWILFIMFIGYFDVVYKGIVIGKDRDDYIEIVCCKVYDLKEYIDVFFDWFKLNFNEFVMDINIVEVVELI